MLLPRCLIVLAVLAGSVLALSGCNEVASLNASLDPKAEPTYWFWARLQGINYRLTGEVEGAKLQLMAAHERADADGIAGGFEALASKYSEWARQLELLDDDKVDSEAVEFRRRFAGTQHELSQLCRENAAAIRERDMVKLTELTQKLEEMKSRVEQMSADRDVLMSTLGKRYRRDFDVAD